MIATIKNIFITFVSVTLPFGYTKSRIAAELTKEAQLAQFFSGDDDNNNTVQNIRGIGRDNVDVIFTSAQLPYTKTFLPATPRTTPKKCIFFNIRDYAIRSTNTYMLSVYAVQGDKRIGELYSA